MNSKTIYISLVYVRMMSHLRFMGERKKYMIIPGASDRILPECSPNEFLGASGLLNNYKTLNSKIVKQMLETPAEIVSTINATSFVEFEMAFKILNKYARNYK